MHCNAAALDISCEDVIRAPRQERKEKERMLYVREAGRERGEESKGARARRLRRARPPPRWRTPRIGLVVVRVWSHCGVGSSSSLSRNSVWEGLGCVRKKSVVVVCIC